MTARRNIFSLLISLTFLITLGMGAKAAEDPMALITELYTAAVKGEGPTLIEADERSAYLSKALMDLWAQIFLIDGGARVKTGPWPLAVSAPTSLRCDPRPGARQHK